MHFFINYSIIVCIFMYTKCFEHIHKAGMCYHDFEQDQNLSIFSVLNRLKNLCLFWIGPVLERQIGIDLGTKFLVFGTFAVAFQGRFPHIRNINVFSTNCAPGLPHTTSPLQPTFVLFFSNPFGLKMTIPWHFLVFYKVSMFLLTLVKSGSLCYIQNWKPVSEQIIPL